MVVVTSFTPPTTGIKHEQASTKLYMNDRDIGNGTIYVTESSLSWVNTTTGKGICLEYPHIAIHAVSKADENYPKPCIYIMLDADIDTDRPEKSDDEEAGGEDQKSTELRFMPENSDVLSEMYEAITECQLLHPDQQEGGDSSNEDEAPPGDDDDEAFMDADDDGLPNRSNGNHPRREVEGQFDDAEVDDGFQEN